MGPANQFPHSFGYRVCTIRAEIVAHGEQYYCLLIKMGDSVCVCYANNLSPVISVHEAPPPFTDEQPSNLFLYFQVVVFFVIVIVSLYCQATLDSPLTSCPWIVTSISDNLHH